MKNLIPLLFLPLFISGCNIFGSVGQNMPGTKITGDIAGHPFSIESKKNTEMTNFVASVEIETNGAQKIKLSIGSIESKQDVPAIDATTAAITVQGQNQVNLFNAFVNGASTLGAAFGSGGASAAAQAVGGIAKGASNQNAKNTIQVPAAENGQPALDTSGNPPVVNGTTVASKPTPPSR